MPRKNPVITVDMPQDLIDWLDANKGPELSRNGFIRTLIRKEMAKTK